MTKKLFAASGVLFCACALSVSAAEPPVAGTNYWVGASSGGSWSDAANWHGVAKDGTDAAPLDLMKKSCFYVFTNLTDGAVVTMDYAGGNDDNVGKTGYTQYALSTGFLFDIPAGATVSVVPGESFSRFLFNNNNSSTPKSILTVNGGMLNWGAKQRTQIDENPWRSHLTVFGTGSVRFTDNEMEFWSDWLYLSSSIDYYFTNTPSMATSGIHCWTTSGRLVVERNGVLKTSAIAADGKKTLEVQEGAELHLQTGFGLNENSKYSWQGAVTGSGTIYSCGGGLDTFLKGNFSANQPFTGCYRWSQGGFVFGTASQPVYLNAASALAADGGGFTHLFGDQTVGVISGVGSDGGIWAPTNHTLTVAGRAAATSTVYSARITGTNTKFVKDGANYELTLNGANDFTGEVEVKAGTLTLDRGGLRRKNLRAAWSFEDAADLGADNSLGGQWRVVPDGVCTSTDPLARLVDDGVQGKALHFGGDSKPLGTILQDASGITKSGVLPSGNDPFTVSFWIRPDLAKCGNYPNFVRWWNGAWNARKGVSFRTINGSGFNRFAMCTDSGWTVTEPLTTNLAAVANMQDSFGNSRYLVDGNWHHIVGTYDAHQTFRLYVDSKLCATAALGANMQMPTEPQIRFGNYSKTDSNHKYAGDLDEVAIYYGCWTDDEVKAEYDSRSPVVAQEILPDPVAHWTFDEEVTENDRRFFRDVSPRGNGLDLESFPNGSGQYATTAPVVQPAPNGGRYVKFPSTSEGAYLQIRSEKALGDYIGSGNVSFTLSVRGTRSMNNKTVLVMGETNNTSKCVRYIHTSNCPRRAQFAVGGSSFTYNDQFQATSVETIGAEWCDLILSYDAESKIMRCYRDGVYVGRSSGISLNLDPVNFIIGRYRGDMASLNTSFDDVRLYDVPLNEAQVRALARRMRTDAGDAPILKTTVPVAVDAGATLVLKGMGESFSNAVSGAGTVEIAKGSTYTVTGLGGFQGTLAINGRATLAALPISLAQAASGDAALACGADGLVTFAPTGTIRVTDAGVTSGALHGKSWTLANAGQITNPQALKDWTFEPALAQGWKVQEKDGKIVLSAKTGWIILFR